MKQACFTCYSQFLNLLFLLFFPTNLHYIFLVLPKKDETFYGESSQSFISFGAGPRPSPVCLGGESILLCGMDYHS